MAFLYPSSEGVNARNACLNLRSIQISPPVFSVFKD